LNSYLGQDPGQYEVFHGGGGNFISNSRMRYPYYEPIGGLHRPLSSTGILTPGQTYETPPNNVCPNLGGTGGGNLVDVDNQTAEQYYAGMVTDTSLLIGLSVSQQTNVLQSIMEAIRQNPAWIGTSMSISQFYNTHLNDFIGKSVGITNMMNQLQGLIETQQNNLSGQLTQLDSLKTLNGSLIDQLLATTDTTVYNAIVAQLLALEQQMHVVDSIIVNAQNQNQLANETQIEVIRSTNAALVTSQLHEAYEKSANEYYLKTWKNIPLDSIEKQILEEIARKCTVEAVKI